MAERKAVNSYLQKAGKKRITSRAPICRGPVPEGRAMAAEAFMLCCCQYGHTCCHFIDKCFPGEHQHVESEAARLVQTRVEKQYGKQDQYEQNPTKSVDDLLFLNILQGDESEAELEACAQRRSDNLVAWWVFSNYSINKVTGTVTPTTYFDTWTTVDMLIATAGNAYSSRHVTDKIAREACASYSLVVSNITQEIFDKEVRLYAAAKAARLRQINTARRIVLLVVFTFLIWWGFISVVLYYTLVIPVPPCENMEYRNAQLQADCSYLLVLFFLVNIARTVFSYASLFNPALKMKILHELRLRLTASRVILVAVVVNTISSTCSSVIRAIELEHVTLVNPMTSETSILTCQTFDKWTEIAMVIVGLVGYVVIRIWIRLARVLWPPGAVYLGRNLCNIVYVDRWISVVNAVVAIIFVMVYCNMKYDELRAFEFEWPEFVAFGFTLSDISLNLFAFKWLMPAHISTKVHPVDVETPATTTTTNTTNTTTTGGTSGAAMSTITAVNKVEKKEAAAFDVGQFTIFTNKMNKYKKDLTEVGDKDKSKADYQSQRS